MWQNFWAAVNEVISEADILLEIIDARAVTETMNPEIEDKVRKRGKTLIYVLNKCDLADKAELDKLKKILMPSVFISCKTYHGITLLKECIKSEARKREVIKPIVGVLGYPNMGKSSVINALSGTKKVRTSSASGFTRGKQNVSTKQFYLIDTPGVIPYGEKDAVKNAMVGITTKSKDPESDVFMIMQEHVGMIESYYKVPADKDKEKTLEKIASILNCVKKGNLPDTARAARSILKDLREGKIKV